MVMFIYHDHPNSFQIKILLSINDDHLLNIMYIYSHYLYILNIFQREIVLLRAEEKLENSYDLWCFCNKARNSRFMICCDRCDYWYHGSCVKVTKSMGMHKLYNDIVIMIYRKIVILKTMMMN